MPATLEDLPKKIPGITKIERLIIDDGSIDNTVDIARDYGVEHIVRFDRNRGLAAAFSAGLEEAIKQGADIIVNTDGDNQYKGGEMAALIAPILSGEAEIVIGERPITKNAHFSFVKKMLQKLGSRFVSVMSGHKIPDAPSGYRAMTRDAALRMNFFSKFTYTLEMIVQAGRSGIALTSVPITTNAPTRPSRLVKSLWSYSSRSFVTVFRVIIVYRPFRFFLILGLIPFFAGLFLSLRWLYFQYVDIGGARIQSLILAAIFFIAAFLSWTLGIIGDLLSINRKILEDIQYKQRLDHFERK